jgi:type IV pilus assembly protein PilB
MKLGKGSRPAEAAPAKTAAATVTATASVPAAAAPVIQPVRPKDLVIQPRGQRIGELLVDAKFVSAAQVVTALVEAQREGPVQLLGERLVAAGLVDERNVAAAIAYQHQLEVVDLRTVSPDPAATRLLIESTARKLVAIPLSTTADSVVVAAAYPTELAKRTLLAEIGRPVTIKVAPPSDILRTIGNSYRALSGITGQVRVFEAQHSVRREPERLDVAGGSGDAPVVRVVQMIITQALRDRASDIHIEPHEERIRVRFRIDGALHDVIDLPVEMGPAVVSRVKILAEMNIVERRRPQDGQISMEIEGRGVDIRVSTTAVIEGEKVVMRLLDKGRELFRLGQLGMPDSMVNNLSGLLQAPYGMVICAGPTGSGKTTTLYGALAEINSPERNVMTIEDPVEYKVPSVNQIQIHEQAGITFATGLRSILRQDPDVILVGEIRDVETARMAVQSALTGHFVLSSLHAIDAPAALHRLLDMGIESFLVASSVTCVLSQRLVRRICQYCRGPYRPSPQELAVLQAIEGREPADGFLRGSGCNFCAQTGFLDRVGVYEMMPITEAIREMILSRAPHDEIRKVARDEGMRTLQEEAARLVANNVTTLAEVMRSIYVVGS